MCYFVFILWLAMICQSDYMAVKCEINEVPIMYCLSSVRCTNEYMIKDGHLYHRTNIPRPAFAERQPESKMLGVLSSCKVWIPQNVN